MSYNLLIYIKTKTFGLVYREFKYSLSKYGSYNVISNDKYNGNYIGCANLSSLTSEFPKSNDDNTITQNFILELNRTTIDRQIGVEDSTLDWFIYYNRMVESEVELYIINENFDSPSITNLLFKGMVKNNGLYYDDNTIKLSIYDRTFFDDKNLCREKYEDGTESNDVINSLKPVIYGDWSSNQDTNTNNGYWLTANITNKNNDWSRNLNCNFCKPNRNGIYDFGNYVKWCTSDDKLKGLMADDTFWNILLANKTNGNFTLNNSSWKYMYDYGDPANQSLGVEDGDKIYIGYPKGNCNDSGALITNPIDIIYDLLIDDSIGLGISLDYIDTDSFSYVKMNNLLVKLNARLYFNDDNKTVINVIGNICKDFGLMLAIVNGKYTLYSRLEIFGELVVFNLVEYRYLISKKDVSNEYYDNYKKMYLSYNYNPKDSKYNKYYPENDEDLTDNEVYKLKSNFIYDENTALQVVNNWLITHNSLTSYKRIILNHNWISFKLGQMAYVHYDSEDSNKVYQGQVIKVNYNFDEMKVEIDIAILKDVVYSGYWLDDIGNDLPEFLGGGIVPIDWSLSTDLQKSLLSYWWESDTDLNDDDGNPLKGWS